MSKLAKILERLLDPRTTLTFQELEYLLTKLGYMEKRTGKTSGSRRAYIDPKSKHIIRLHKPHPGNEIKKYIKNYIIEELKKEKLI
ncbi:MAG: type II toxin-antitoxin system HicA family toxin [Saprospiraceae bacterium]|nr:type II toxin-antitoxin system HicA family toxin [Saprospiraceae bacterium]